MAGVSSTNSTRRLRYSLSASRMSLHRQIEGENGAPPRAGAVNRELAAHGAGSERTAVEPEPVATLARRKSVLEEALQISRLDTLSVILNLYVDAGLAGHSRDHGTDGDLV